MLCFSFSEQCYIYIIMARFTSIEELNEKRYSLLRQEKDAYIREQHTTPDELTEIHNAILEMYDDVDAVIKRCYLEQRATIDLSKYHFLANPIWRLLKADLEHEGFGVLFLDVEPGSELRYLHVNWKKCTGSCYQNII